VVNSSVGFSVSNVVTSLTARDSPEEFHFSFFSPFVTAVNEYEDQ